MSKNSNLLSIIIPTYNEEKFIRKCIDSILKTDYPKNQLEVIFIDGKSEDRTCKIINGYKKKYPFIKLIDNPKTITPSALNLGIKNSNGEYIIRLDAHSEYPKDYFSLCIEYLNKTKADNVGGVVINIPYKDGVFSKAIALALSSVFGVGNSNFRTGIKEETKYVDTVPFGAFKKETFDKVGLFNESMFRNEDVDLNLRIRKAGGKILLVSKIKVFYLCDTALKMFKKYFYNGFLVTEPLLIREFPFSSRHIIPMLFVLSIVISLIVSIKFSILPILILIISYLLINLWYSFLISLKEKSLLIFFVIPLVFSLLHLCHGFGALAGLINNLFQKLLKNNY